MLGAICGDIIGSVYEAHNIKAKEFDLFTKFNCYTDDTVMTCAIAKASHKYKITKDKEQFKKDCIDYMKQFGRHHIRAGYGGRFLNWLLSDDTEPYNSFGNGSAMRVSSVSYVASTIEEAEELAEISASVTHNHPEGIKGAKAVAGSVWLLLHKRDKETVKKYIEDNYYDINFSIDSIRKDYKFDVSCQGSVPQAIVAFMDSNNYEDSIRNAVSIGGDSDTIAAITGSLAEAHYGVPKSIAIKATSYLPEDLIEPLSYFYDINKIKEVEMEESKRKRHK